MSKKHEEKEEGKVVPMDTNPSPVSITITDLTTGFQVKDGKEVKKPDKK